MALPSQLPAALALSLSVAALTSSGAPSLAHALAPFAPPHAEGPVNVSDPRIVVWTGPLGADSDQAADLTVGRVLRSSNCCGLR